MTSDWVVMGELISFLVTVILVICFELICPIATADMRTRSTQHHHINYDTVETRSNDHGNNQHRDTSPQRAGEIPCTINHTSNSTDSRHDVPRQPSNHDPDEHYLPTPVQVEGDGTPPPPPVRHQGDVPRTVLDDPVGEEAHSRYM